MGAQLLAVGTGGPRDIVGDAGSGPWAARIRMPIRVVAPLGAMVSVPYAAPGADRVTYEPFDPWSGPQSVPATGAFDALAAGDVAYHRVSGWWGRTSLRRTVAVEGWRQPVLLIEHDGGEAFDPAMLPTVSGFGFDLVWVQRNACAMVPPAFQECPMPRAASGLVVMAQLRCAS